MKKIENGLFTDFLKLLKLRIFMIVGLKNILYWKTNRFLLRSKENYMSNIKNLLGVKRFTVKNYPYLVFLVCCVDENVCIWCKYLLNFMLRRTK